MATFITSHHHHTPPSPHEQKVNDLQNLKSRIQTRLSTLRKSQVAIMIERNLYLSKLRQVENYGRDHDWGNNHTDDDSNSSPPEQGQELLHSIYDVLYDASKEPPPQQES